VLQFPKKRRFYRNCWCTMVGKRRTWLCRSVMWRRRQLRAGSPYHLTHCTGSVDYGVVFEALLDGSYDATVADTLVGR
jgi:hypothetical protein